VSRNCRTFSKTNRNCSGSQRDERERRISSENSGECVISQEGCVRAIRRTIGYAMGRSEKYLSIASSSCLIEYLVGTDQGNDRRSSGQTEILHSIRAYGDAHPGCHLRYFQHCSRFGRSCAHSRHNEQSMAAQLPRDGKGDILLFCHPWTTTWAQG
jgi:hypothetical protein